MNYEHKNKYQERMDECVASLPGRTPERVAAAKRLFTKIGTDHNSGKQLFEEDLDELNTYPDIIDNETFDKWKKELGPSRN
jgi:hypothetical protein